MKKTVLLLTAVALGASGAWAEAQENFLKQQAYQEMQRVSGQIDVLQNNFNDLAERVGKLERKPSGETVSRAEIESIRGSISELRTEMSRMRQEIVKDLSARLVSIQKEQARSVPPPAPVKPAKPVYSGKCDEYVVQEGDSLYMIALAFKTNVETIKSMNNLKSNNLRIGQKLLVPRVKE